MSLVWSLALAAHLGSAPAAAPQPTDIAPGIEEVDDFETLEPSAATPKPLSATQFVGRLHPAVVHFPIAWVLLFALLELAVVVAGARRLGVVSKPLGLVTLASFVPAIVSGLLRLRELPSDPTTLPSALLHRNVMVAAAVLVVVAVGLRLKRREQMGGAMAGGYLALLVAASALVLFGGHLGGLLVYGASYLPF